MKYSASFSPAFHTQSLTTFQINLFVVDIVVVMIVVVVVVGVVTFNQSNNNCTKILLILVRLSSTLTICVTLNYSLILILFSPIEIIIFVVSKQTNANLLVTHSTVFQIKKTKKHSHFLFRE